MNAISDESGQRIMGNVVCESVTTVWGGVPPGGSQETPAPDCEKNV